MRKFTEVSFSPTVIRMEEFLMLGFGKAIVALFLMNSCVEYPTTAATISTSAEGLMYRITSLSVLFATLSKAPAKPLCEAPCSKAALQVSVYVGPVFTHNATIKGDNVIVKGYHDEIC